MVVRGQSGKAVDIPVEHAEGGGDQHRVVDLDVGGALVTGTLDVCGLHIEPAPRDLGRDVEQCPELGAHVGGRRVVAHGVDQVVVALEIVSGRGPVAGMTEVAVVSRGDIGGDHLSLSAGQGARATEKDFGKLAHRLGRLRPEGERTGDSWKLGGQGDVGHGLYFRIWTGECMYG